MTDRKLRALSKMQLLEMLHKQAEEIERLTKEAEAHSEKSAPASLEEITEAVQKTMTSYLQSAKAAEDKRADSIAALESNARFHNAELDRLCDRAAQVVDSARLEMDKIFSHMIGLIDSMKDDVNEKHIAASVANSSASNSPDEID